MDTLLGGEMRFMFSVLVVANDGMRYDIILKESRVSESETIMI